LENEKDEAIENDIHPKEYLSMFKIPGSGELQFRPFYGT
jgi:hypothetical protein